MRNHRHIPTTLSFVHFIRSSRFLTNRPKLFRTKSNKHCELFGHISSKLWCCEYLCARGGPRKFLIYLKKSDHIVKLHNTRSIDRPSFIRINVYLCVYESTQIKNFITRLIFHVSFYGFDILLLCFYKSSAILWLINWNIILCECTIPLTGF